MFVVGPVADVLGGDVVEIVAAVAHTIDVVDRSVNSHPPTSLLSLDLDRVDGTTSMCPSLGLTSIEPSATAATRLGLDQTALFSQFRTPI